MLLPGLETEVRTAVQWEIRKAQLEAARLVLDLTNRLHKAGIDPDLANREVWKVANIVWGGEQ